MNQLFSIIFPATGENFTVVAETYGEAIDLCVPALASTEGGLKVDVAPVPPESYVKLVVSNWDIGALATTTAAEAAEWLGAGFIRQSPPFLKRES